MDAITKKDGSVGRARGHSMLSTLKAMSQEQAVGGEPQRGHSGISLERLHAVNGQDVGKVVGGGLDARPSIDTATGRIVSESRVSALTMAFQRASASPVAGSGSITIKPTFALPTDEPSPPGSPTGSGSDSEKDIPTAFADHEPDLRNWCSGLPPKKSFLGSDRNLPPRLRLSRRNTLADKPELDVLLAATKVAYNGHSYLPLTAQTIHRLSPYFKGAKPLADTKIFECIIVTHEVNGVHADHVVDALERIGEYCNHLLVMSPVQTSELGNVFTREAGNVEPGNDWDHILKCFPKLNHLVFVHPIDEPVELSRNTFYSLQLAVGNRQAAKQIKSFSFNGPPELLTYFHYDLAMALEDDSTI